MKPKYLLYDYKHDMMLMNALRAYRTKGYRMHIGILKEHQDEYNVIGQIQHEWMDNINYVIIDKPTRGPADTVYQILKQSKIDINSPILIKDCDSFFEHDNEGDNYICVSKIYEHEVLKKLASKSFVTSNDQGIVTDIIEKKVVSDTFCVGGYKFASKGLYMRYFESLTNTGEVFVSDVIQNCISKGYVFTEKRVTNYVDVGTATDWFEYNDRPVIFCDIDGTIIKVQSRLDLESRKPFEPLINNMKRLLELQEKGAEFVFVTAREAQYKTQTREMLYTLGFKSFELIVGVQNSKRIIINDYNNANPYPRAEAINLKRDSDNLSDFL
jgi:dTDP-glucose pyrophosphorylase